MCLTGAAMTIETLVKRLAEASYGVRCNSLYSSVLEDRAMDAHIVIAVMHEYARARGFSNFEQLDRFMTPPPPAVVQHPTHHSTLAFEERQKA